MKINSSTSLIRFSSEFNLNLNNKVVFIRSDMNVPLVGQQITDDTRIQESLDTIEQMLKLDAKIIIATHLGRPEEGVLTKNDSVAPIRDRLNSYLNTKINISCHLEQLDFVDTQIIMLENVRCNIGEKVNALELAHKYANLADIAIHDAFAVAHRKEASTYGVFQYAKQVMMGTLMERELKALTKIKNNPLKPVIAVIGGSKISTKLAILNNLAVQVDQLIVGGGILNTFLLAQGYDIGASLVEKNLLIEAKQIIDKMKQRGATLLLPQQVMVSNKFNSSAKAQLKPLGQLNSDDMIMDVSSEFAHSLIPLINQAKTIIWNGPMGVFEFDNFALGTKIIANAIAESSAFSLAGGGDTIAAINKYGLYSKISYVSTAGGALLEYLADKELAGLNILEQRFIEDRHYVNN